MLEFDVDADIVEGDGWTLKNSRVQQKSLFGTSRGRR